MVYRLFVMNHFVVMHDVAMMDHMFLLVMHDRTMRLRHRHRRQRK
jgi:hypothetical protein